MGYKYRVKYIKDGYENTGTYINLFPFIKKITLNIFKLTYLEIRFK